MDLSNGSACGSGRCCNYRLNADMHGFHLLRMRTFNLMLLHQSVAQLCGCSSLQEVQWANYSDFQHPDADANPATPTGETDDVAAMMASLKPQSSAPKLRLDWDAAYAILAAANATKAQ